MESYNHIHFILNPKDHTELVICQHSMLSYPLHSHVSVYTAGMLLEGAVLLSTPAGTGLYEANQMFFIPPYVPHSLKAVSPYTMLTLCINKEKIITASSPAGLSVLERLRDELEQLPERQITIDEMADMVHISKYHFIRSFKQEIGLTPHQFQLQNRIRKAKLLLRQDKTITETALDAGFYDQSHFIKQFEKAVGMTPTAYLASCRSL